MVNVDVPTAAVRIGEQVLSAADAAAGVELPVGHYPVHVEAAGHLAFDGELDVSESELATLRRAGVSDGETLEIVSNVVLNIFTNYINHVAETDIDFPVVRAKSR